jgi:hypothetical protein
VSVNVYLRAGSAGNDVYLRRGQSIVADVWLQAHGEGNDVYLRPTWRRFAAAAESLPPGTTYFVTVTMTAIGTVSTGLATVFGLASSATAVGSAAVQKLVGKLTSYSAVGTQTVLKQVGKLATPTAVGTPTLIKQVGKVLAVTAIGTLASAQSFIAGSAAAVVRRWKRLVTMLRRSK